MSRLPLRRGPVAGRAGKRAGAVGGWSIVAGVLVVIVSASSAVALVLGPVKILAGPEDQQDPRGNGTYLLWDQNSEAKPGRYNVFASDDGGASSFRVNRRGTRGFTGDVRQDANEAIYQEVDEGRSDLQMIDLASRQRSDPPAGINTRNWEWSPRLSADYILFIRDVARTSRRLLILYDRGARTKTTLVDVPRKRVWLYAYHVGSAYVTWERADADGWSAWIYDIAGGTKTRIPTVGGRGQYGPVVDEINGNAYWVRSGAGDCGHNVRILEAPLTALDAPTVVATMPDGVDVWTMSLEEDSANARMDLLFTRFKCRSSQGDLYELQGVDDLLP